MDINAIQPLSEARIRAMSSGEIKEVEQEIIQHIILIAEKHCTAAGREFKIDKTPTDYWFLFGMHLHGALIKHTRELEDARNLAFLRGLFEEIFDFLMFAYNGTPTYQIAEMIKAFGTGITCGPILPLLLPARAQPVLAEADAILDAQHEEDLRRQDQMGY